MLKRLFAIALLTVVAFAAGADAYAAVPLRPQIDVTGYVIRVDLDPATGRLRATAAVTFTALEDLDVAVFGLNNGLQVESVRDGDQASLACVRNVGDSTVSVTPAAVVPKGSSVTWTFKYAGVPTLATSPVNGTDFVQLHDPVSALLYPGRWFPIALPGLFTDRFTAEIHVTVPKGETVVGSRVGWLAVGTSWAMGACNLISIGAGRGFLEAWWWGDFCRRLQRRMRRALPST